MLFEPEISKSKEIAITLILTFTPSRWRGWWENTLWFNSDSVSPVQWRIDWPGTGLSKYNFIYSPWNKDIDTHTEQHLFDQVFPTHSREIAECSFMADTSFLILSNTSLTLLKKEVWHLEISGFFSYFSYKLKTFFICPTHPLVWKCHRGDFKNYL